MTNFKSYYHTKFRDDLLIFFSTIPEESKFHEDKENKQLFSIQYERLTPQKNHLDFLDKEAKEYFGVALFFTVLTDMVCYSHYSHHYPKFQVVTRYPKLIGNCLSWCRYHLHPRDIFIAMNQGSSATQQNLIFTDKFQEANDIMKDETVDFFKLYLMEVDGDDFWEQCKKEFPYTV